MKVVLFLLALSFALIAKAQYNLSGWKDHLPYRKIIALTESSDKIYCAAEEGVFSFHKTEFSMEKLSKISVLSDVGVTAIHYSIEMNILLVGYSNGNIDLVYADQTTNIPDLKNKMTLTNKRINQFIAQGDYAYAATSSGVLKINLERKEIAETYFLGSSTELMPVSGIALMNDYIYAATTKGIYRGKTFDTELAVFDNWEPLSFLNMSIPYLVICTFDNKILTASATEPDVLKVLDMELQQVDNYDLDCGEMLSLHASADRISATGTEKLSILNSNFLPVLSWTKYPSWLWDFNPRYAISHADGKTWVADYGYGLGIFEGDVINFSHPDGPKSTDAVDISIEHNEVLVAGGSEFKRSSWNGAYLLKDGKWHTIDGFEYPPMNKMQNISNVLIDPRRKGHYYCSSWGYGLAEITNGEAIVYDETNSVLQPVPTYGTNAALISGMALNPGGDLYMTTTLSRTPIYQLNSDDKTIETLDLNYGSFGEYQRIGNIIVTQGGQKWAISAKSGIMVFDDQKERHFELIDQDGAIISSEIKAIAEDLNGVIWLGTAEGVFAYYSPASVFDETPIANRIIIDFEGSPQYLLGTEKVTDIAIDGANRKWFATESGGVFLFSADGTEEILHLNTENSPLLSNTITTIAVNGQNGEVFIGTEKGLVSFLWDATQGEDSYENVLAYPNPVREDFHGEVTISGLMRDSQVRITDLNGNPVFEDMSKGGLIRWDLNNFLGKRVQTGIYLVFCVNDDGTSSCVTKLLVIH